MYFDPTKSKPGYRYSEGLDGQFVSSLSKAAREFQVHIVCGMTEANPEDTARPYNTLVYIDKQGELVDSYRKIHLYDAFGNRESDRVTPAKIGHPLVFDIGGVRVGALTCYDLRFPEIFRWIADEDVDTIVLPAAWVAGSAKEFHWETLLKARAIENTVYIAGSGQTGPSCVGQSMIIDPMGVTLASAGEEPGTIASGIVSTDRIGSVRATNPSLNGRRFEVSPIDRL